MIEFLSNLLSTAAGFLQTLFLVYAVGLVVERLLPAAQRDQPAADVATNIFYTIVFVVLGVLLTPSFEAGARAIQGWLGGGLKLAPPLPENEWRVVVQIVAYVVVFDFFYYWWHRLQHSPLLWPQHMFHHADVSVNVTTSVRHHWLEQPLRAFLLWLPMNLLFDLPVVAWVGFGLFLLYWSVFTHMNIRLPLGWLTAVIAGPQWHRIHHSVLPQHQNRNFAAYLPIWDLVFGTYYAPARDEYPPTGLQERQSRVGIVEGSLYPFRAVFAFLGRRARRSG